MMKQKFHTLAFAFIIMTIGTLNAQSQLLNSIPAEVKIYRNTPPKVLNDMTLYKVDGTYIDKYTYQYNDEKRLASALYQYWDKDIKTWKDVSKNSYIYNANNALAEELFQYWNDSEGWKNSSRKTFNRDTKGFVSEELTQEWDSNGKWEQATSRNLYSYNSNGLKTMYIGEFRTATADAWKDSSNKVTYTYNTAGTITEEIFQIQNRTTKTWVNSERYTYTYDASTYQMNCTYYQWISGKWQTVNKIICHYNTNGNIIRCDYYTSLDDSSLKAYCLYTYSNTTNTNKIHVEKELSVYPNPATSHIIIETNNNLTGKTVYLYDYTGKLHKSIIINNKKEQINVSNLIDGVYFIKIDNLTKKIVIR